MWKCECVCVPPGIGRWGPLAAAGSPSPSDTPSQTSSAFWWEPENKEWMTESETMKRLPFRRERRSRSSTTLTPSSALEARRPQRKKVWHVEEPRVDTVELHRAERPLEVSRSHLLPTTTEFTRSEDAFPQVDKNTLKPHNLQSHLTDSASNMTE